MAHQKTLQSPSAPLLRQIRADVLSEAKAALSHLAGVQVNAQAAPIVKRLVDDHCPRWEGPPEAGAAAAAWAIAQAVDETQHQRFVPRLRAAGEQRITPGRAYLVHRFDALNPHPLIDGKVNTGGEILLEDSVRATSHVSIADGRAARHTFVIDWDSYDRLTALSELEHLRIAACQPYEDLADYDVEFIDDGEEPRFRNYGPTPEDPQTERVMAQLGAALDVRADIILFPEYAVPARA